MRETTGTGSDSGPGAGLLAIDTHVDTILRAVDLGHRLDDPAEPGWMDLPRAREGGLAAAFFACCVEPEHVAAGRGPERLETLLAAVEGFVAANPDGAVLARTPGDIRAAAAAGRLAVLPCIEGAQGIGRDLARLADFARRGVAYISPTHFASNEWADSSTGARRHGGLSGLGREALAEMARLGIAADVSHVSDEAFRQIVETAPGPVLASHSSARALVDHPRNLSDDMIRALAARGGLIGVTFWPEYLSRRYRAELEAAAGIAGGTGPGQPRSGIAVLLERAGDDPLARYQVLVEAGIPFPALDEVLDHLDHVIALAGAEHVCFGSDHGACNFGIAGLESCAALPALLAGLLARGHGEEDARNVLGRNVLRFLAFREEAPA